MFSHKRNLKTCANQLNTFLLPQKVLLRKYFSCPQEEFNPLSFCMVTMEEGHEEQTAAATASGGCKPEEALQAYKKYVCTYCNKRFGWSTDLKRHILTHTGERPFQCQLCGATFTRNFLLQKHVLKLHSNNQCVVPVATPSEPKKPPTSPGLLAVSPEPPSGAATEVRRPDHKQPLDTAVAAKRRCLEPLQAAAADH